MVEKRTFFSLIVLLSLSSALSAMDKSKLTRMAVRMLQRRATQARFFASDQIPGVRMSLQYEEEMTRKKEKEERERNDDDEQRRQQQERDKREAERRQEIERRVENGDFY